MSADDGSVKNTLGSESSYSSVSCGDARRKKEYGRKDRKTIRILTVMAYIFCVSMAAALLSAYYVFLWNPGPVPEKSSRLHHTSRGKQQISTTPFPTKEVITSELPAYFQKSSVLHHDEVEIGYGNTDPYQQRQIDTPLPLPMTTQFLTTSPPGLPTTTVTTTSPSPPVLNFKINPIR